MQNDRLKTVPGGGGGGGGQGVFIKISSKSNFYLFLIEGSDSYQKHFTK